MVRSKSSCCKMITCGGGGSRNESIRDDDDVLGQTEGKGSTDKRGWSFRKRSTRPRVLSNTVISDISSSGRKNIADATSKDFHPQTVPQKMEDMTPLSTSLNSKLANIKVDPLVPLFVVESDNVNTISLNLEESSAIVVQTAIRGYLARTALLKLKNKLQNIVKLQAAFRGHLERRKAVGTLRCVQAIVKMQTLVRARSARISLQGSAIVEKLDGDHDKLRHNQVILGRQQSGSKANINHSSTQRLLSNGFARQLLESAPKKKRIHLKCDPSKADSAWKWLERWVSVSSSDSQHAYNSLSGSVNQKKEERVGNASNVEFGVPPEVLTDSVDLKPTKTKSPLECEENSRTYDADNFKYQACSPSSFSTINVTQRPQFDDADFRKSHDTSLTDDMSLMEVDAISETLFVSLPNKPEAGSEHRRRSMKRAASEQPENEGKKFVLGSRKACNPAFAAVQTKFEELSTISGRLNNSSQVFGVESKFDTISSTEESGTRKKQHSLAESLISHEPKIYVGGSDCGTELSITSTLDSPDSYEVGGTEFEPETKEKVSSELQKTTDNGSILQNVDVSANNSSFTSQCNSSYTIPHPGKFEEFNDEYGEAAVPVNSSPLEQQPVRNAPDMQFQMETQTVQQTCSLSSEGSPRSHITVPESYGTPSRQISVKVKNNNLDKSCSSQSRKSLSAGKRSPSNPNEFGARNSTEQLKRDLKNGKRRNSFGSPKPDHVDQEPRDCNSNSLPSYMQATESARAKALVNISPRSSPDVQDRVLYVKKRHSLPGANGTQLSPRMQRSMSQAQEGAKGSGIHTQDRKWQR